MQIVITNVSSSGIYIREFYKEIAAGASLTTTINARDISAMQGLIAQMAAGTVTVTLTPSASELSTGMLAPPQSVQTVDIAPVASTVTNAPLLVFKGTMTAGVTGTADDVTVIAANALPFKFRVVKAFANISAATALSTLNVYTRAAAAGTLLAGPIDSGSTGVAVSATGPATSEVATPASTEGLFIRRSDRAVAGEVFLFVIKES